PVPRANHMSALIGNRLYFFGGSRQMTPVVEEFEPDFFYLDLSIEFNASTPAFTSLGLPNNWVGFDVTSAVVGGNNDSTILIFGGFSVSIILCYNERLFSIDVNNIFFKKVHWYN